MRFCQSFMNGAVPSYRARTPTFPQGDIGVGAQRDRLPVRSCIKQADGASSLRRSDGQGAELRRVSLARKEATGYGLCYFARRRCLHDCGLGSFAGSDGRGVGLGQRGDLRVREGDRRWARRWWRCRIRTGIFTTRTGIDLDRGEGDQGGAPRADSASTPAGHASGGVCGGLLAAIWDGAVRHCAALRDAERD